MRQRNLVAIAPRNIRRTATHAPAGLDRRFLRLVRPCQTTVAQPRGRAKPEHLQNGVVRIDKVQCVADHERRPILFRVMDRTGEIKGPKRVFRLDRTLWRREQRCLVVV